MITMQGSGLGASFTCHASSTTGDTVCSGDSRFSQLQSQLNKAALTNGYGTIAVDGEIGPATLDLYYQLVVDDSVNNAQDLANNIDEALASINAIVGSPPAAVPKSGGGSTSSGGGTKAPMPSLSIGSATPWYTYAGIGLGVLVAGWFVATTISKGSRRRAYAR